jgi:predicted dehydrogenase
MALRVGVIGVGHLGKEHARILAGLEGVQLAGVADVSRTQAEAIAERCGTRAFTDYRELLPEIDAAVVAVPTTYHHAVATEVLSRGIAALVEKPLALTPAQAEDLFQCSQKHRTLLQVGHIERFNPAFESLQQRPLTPRYLSAERMGGYTGRSTDVGVVLDLMIHDLDLILALARSEVIRVEALGLSVLGGHEDLATARIVFANGCVADLHASRVAPAPSRRMRIWAEEGFAEVDFSKRRLSLVQPSEALCRHRAGIRPFDSATQAALKQNLMGEHLQTLELDCNRGDQLTKELEEFIRCVQSGARPRVAGEEGCTALALASKIIGAIAVHSWDGTQGTAVGPHAFAVPPARLFETLQREQAA